MKKKNEMKIEFEWKANGIEEILKDPEMKDCAAIKPRLCFIKGWPKVF